MTQIIDQSEPQLRNREQMEIADHLWNLTETPDNGLYRAPYWEDIMIMGDYLYKLGYRRVAEKQETVYISGEVV